MLKPLVARSSKMMTVVAGVTLMLVMLLTVVDVVLRYFGRPITGVYDLVALGGAVIIGFSIPHAAFKRVHVYMEMAEMAQSRTVRRVLNVIARLIAFAVSLLLGWNLFKLGAGFFTTGEASLTVQIAYYPVAMGLGVCFFLQTLVFGVQLVDACAGGPSHE